MSAALALGVRRATVHDQAFMSTDPARPLLVLWDIDQTLIEVGGATRRAYAAAFHRATGQPLDQPWQFNGRTELAAATEVLRAHGVNPSRALVDSFIALIVEELHDRADQMLREGRALPGAEDALLACRAVPGVHQSVLTGNLYPLAVLKVTVFGLAEHLDLRIGAFGGDGLDRAELPAHAWHRARLHLGRRFSGTDTVIIGDTPLDVATGKRAGAHVVAVATGPVSAAELAAAGADVVLADLTDTAAVVDTIVKPHSTPTVKPRAAVHRSSRRDEEAVRGYNPNFESPTTTGAAPV
jgi:phosphoglycolate phosphatase